MGEDATLLNLVNQWAILKIPEDKIEFAGCFLTWNFSHFARPNARRFIHNLKEYVDMCSSGTKKITKNRKCLISLSTKPPKVMSLEMPSPSSNNSYQAKIKGKWNKMTSCYTMDFSISIPLKGRARNTPSDFGKGFCLCIVRNGVNQMISQRVIVQNYVTGYEGLLSYHKFSVGLADNQAGSSIPTPAKVKLNEHNIIDAEHAILNTYKNNQNSLYGKLKRFPVWSLMHEEIYEFSTKCNGVSLKGIDGDQNPFDVTFCLTNAYGTADVIILSFIDFTDLKKDAYSKIIQYFNDASMDNATLIAQTPPNYFILGILLKVNELQKANPYCRSPDLPIGNTGDGVTTNVRAGCILTILYGLNSPDYRCAAHIASGAVKQMTTLTTMNMEEVTDFQSVLRMIIKHFKSSIKNKELYDKYLSVLQVKPIHMILWC